MAIVTGDSPKEDFGFNEAWQDAQRFHREDFSLKQLAEFFYLKGRANGMHDGMKARVPLLSDAPLKLDIDVVGAPV